MVTSTQPEIEIEAYKGFLFQPAQNKKIEEYKKAVDIFHQNIQKDYDGSPFPEKMEEVLSQAIVMKIMPDYKIIKIDNGNEASQTDLIALKQENKIAIEITQFTKENNPARKSKENSVYDSKKTKRKWTIHINNNHDVKSISKSTIPFIDGCLSNIAGKSQPNEEIIIFLNSEVKKEIAAEISQLEGRGVTYIYGKKESTELSSIHLIFFDSASLSIESTEKRLEVLQEILDVAITVSLKEDIQKKFKKCTANERHLFIPVTFSFDKGQYIACYLEHYKFFMNDFTGFAMGDLTTDPEKATDLNEKKALKKAAEDLKKAIEIIDVIWISLLYHWTPSKKMAFSLIKIIKQGNNLVFHPVFHQELYPNIINP